MSPSMNRICFTIAITGIVVVGSVRTARVQSLPPLAFSAPHRALFQTPQDKPTEQVQKNIQVLQGLPQSQLIPVMNFMSTSLGVRCTFCHVNNAGQWDFAADTKPEKGTAREMIKMVQNVNKTTFRGNTEVSCWTCHRGRTHPETVPPLPVAVSSPPAAAAASPSASPSPTPGPPTADQILARYTEALGGPGAFAKIKSRSLKGTWLTSTGASWGYEVLEAAPDRLFMILNAGRQGTFERGISGTIAWEQSARGVRDVAGDEIAAMRRNQSLFSDLKLKEQFSTLTFVGRDKIGDHDVYILRGMDTANKRERLYFDAQTGLLVRRMVFTPTPVGVIPEQVDYDDYRDVEGVKMPFTIRVSSVDPNGTSTRQFTEIKINVPVDEVKFNKPAPKPTPSP